MEIVEAYRVHLITWVPNRWPLQPYLQTCLSEYGGRLLLASLSCDVLPAVLGEAHLTEGTRASFLATRDAYEAQDADVIIVCWCFAFPVFLNGSRMQRGAALIPPVLPDNPMSSRSAHCPAAAQSLWGMGPLSYLSLGALGLALPAAKLEPCTSAQTQCGSDN